MATIATYEKFIEQHPNASLVDLLGLNGNNPTNYDGWFDGLQDLLGAWVSTHDGVQPSVDEFALAVYEYWTDPQNVTNWADRLTSAQLTQALTGLKQPDSNGNASDNPAFPTSSDVTSAVNAHYLDIKIVVDAAAILERFNNYQNVREYVGNYIVMSDNHKESSSGEGTDELNSEGLQPNMTITWSAFSASGGHAIELTAFLPNSQVNFERLAPMPANLGGSGIQWITKANPKLPPQIESTYHFNLTIDNGDATYWFDPFIGDQRAS